MKKRQQEVRSKFIVLENHFLNTFYSGLYLSAGDFIAIGRQNGLALQMHSREMLIKELLNESEALGTINGVLSSLNLLIDDRINTYHTLSLQYPAARAPLTRLAQKSNGTKSLLARESRGNPYEH
ncbi:MAG: hypothetical protein Q8K81_03590 [Sulfuricurvum sp.]|nr:hypothetical protein [Sulfuricurvum sp.]